MGACRALEDGARFVPHGFTCRVADDDVGDEAVVQDLALGPAHLEKKSNLVDVNTHKKNK